MQANTGKTMGSQDIRRVNYTDFVVFDGVTPRGINWLARLSDVTWYGRGGYKVAAADDVDLCQEIEAAGLTYYTEEW